MQDTFITKTEKTINYRDETCEEEGESEKGEHSESIHRGKAGCQTKEKRIQVNCCHPVQYCVPSSTEIPGVGQVNYRPESPSQHRKDHPPTAGTDTLRQCLPLYLPKSGSHKYLLKLECLPSASGFVPRAVWILSSPLIRWRFLVDQTESWKGKSLIFRI